MGLFCRKIVVICNSSSKSNLVKPLLLAILLEHILCRLCVVGLLSLHSL